MNRNPADMSTACHQWRQVKGLSASCVRSARWVGFVGVAVPERVYMRQAAESAIYLWKRL